MEKNNRRCYWCSGHSISRGCTELRPSLLSRSNLCRWDRLKRLHWCFLLMSVTVLSACAKHWRPPQIPEWAPGRWLKNRRAEARVPPWDQKQQSDWWEHNSWGTKLRHDFRYTGGGSGLLLRMPLRSRSFQDGCPAFASFWFSKLKVLFEICRSPPPFV